MERTGRMIENLSWQDDAACLNADRELFFPSQGSRDTVEAAKEVCAGCTVREQCLEYALRTNQSDGTWGGLSAVERRSIKRRAAEARRRHSA